MATTSIFAVTDSFTVTTTVAEIGLIKITTASIGTADTFAAYSALTDYNELTVTAAGTQGFTAFMTTLSNKRTGYNVKLSATAMTSTVGTTSYINYTVTANGVSVTTNGATVITPVTVLNVASLTAIDGDSKPISLTVDATTFNAAVSGTYVGNVTFTFTAN